MRGFSSCWVDVKTRWGWLGILFTRRTPHIGCANVPRDVRSSDAPIFDILGRSAVDSAVSQRIYVAYCCLHYISPSSSAGQSCPWVGSTRGLGWVRLGRDFAVFDGLGWIWQKYYIFWWLHNIQLQGAVEVNYKGVWKIGVSRPISRFISKTVQDTAVVTMEDHALTADSFAVSCIGLGLVGSGHRKWTHGQFWCRLSFPPHLPTSCFAARCYA